MNSIVKSQLYDLRKTKMPFIILILICIVELIFCLGNMNFDGRDVASTYISTSSGVYIPWALTVGICFVGMVCGKDYHDKTINYEIMNGHSRKEVYLGRALVGVIGGTIGTALALAIPIFVAQLIIPIGDGLSNKVLIGRFLLSLFPIARIMCEIVFVTVLVKNQYVTIGIAYFVAILGEMLMMLFETGGFVLLGLNTLSKLFDFVNYGAYHLADNDSVLLYESYIGVGDVLAVIISSIAFGAVFVFLGYIFFRKDDLK